MNRRIIVDEAFERAKELARKLRDAPVDGILGQVAAPLRALAGGGDSEPLACAELRGGIYRDRAWAKSLLQPMILCSTVDQAGSRLLFRGYGVSAEASPIHAALVAHDSLLLIDEAHISQPFVETLGWVKRYRAFQPAEGETVALPFSLICLTATPPTADAEASKLELSEADRIHPILEPRLNHPKLAQLVHAPKAKGKAWNDELAKELAVQAATIIKDRAPRSIAIMVNRVATARAAYVLARKNHPAAEVTLLLGRMRPLDRDAVTERLQAVLKTARPGEVQPKSPLQIVVSTQCLEVGADFDFDALVTECSSLDALRQRFGRLNRGGRPITAHAAIVLPEEQNIALEKLDDTKPIDPIYGNAIPRAWAWLQSLPDGADFGLRAMTAAVAAVRETENGEQQLQAMLTPVSKAPILLPAYLDCWVQTNPRPAADPDIAIFLHGRRRDMAEVQVCWRADLPGDADEQAWIETLALCPPTPLECLPVPLHLIRQWLENGGRMRGLDISGDAPQAVPEIEAARNPARQHVDALIWRGAKTRPGNQDGSEFFQNARALRPGDTIILRAQEGGWEEIGHLPEPVENVDCAERGQAKLRRRAFIRLHPALWQSGTEDSAASLLMKWAGLRGEGDWTAHDLKQMLAAAAAEKSGELKTRLDHLTRKSVRVEVEPYPAAAGVVLSTKALLPAPHDAAELGPPDDSADDPLLESPEPQTLDAHTAQVRDLAAAYAGALSLSAFADAITRAAELHDLGKADRRFQALLIGSDVTAALAQPILWAKSATIPTSAKARRHARERASLPRGFRHEMLSTQLAESAAAASLFPADEPRTTLALHLIASHHGHARPLAPVVEDDSPPSVSLNNPELALTPDERLARPAHAIDSGVAERFWRLTRHHGWWGLAFLEAILRLADQTASALPPAKSES